MVGGKDVPRPLFIERPVRGQRFVLLDGADQDRASDRICKSGNLARESKRLHWIGKGRLAIENVRLDLPEHRQICGNQDRAETSAHI